MLLRYPSGRAGPLAALAALLLWAGPLQAQQTGTVSGRVVNASNLQPIASAQVFIPSLNTGALTREDGRYILVNIPAGSHTVNAQILGYRTATAEVTVSAGQTATADFSMQQDALALDEIIVTGTPGGSQRRAIGNTVTRVTAADVVEQVAITSMQDMLTARTPGLNFGRSNGSVGGGSEIQIRGTGSFNLGSQPLVFVDGIRIDNSSRSGPATANAGFGMTSSDRGGGGETSILDDLNPEEIESIEIIKGPAAATLYGTEASAGVIQIITKKGQSGAPQFNLTVRQGANFMRDPAGRLGDQYACSSRPAPPCPEADIFRYNMYDEANKYISGASPGPDGGQYFEWPTKNLYQYGHGQTYNLDVRGGTDLLRYFVSAGYQDDEGAVWYNWDKTYRFRGNLTTVFADNFNVDVSMGYLQGDARLADPAFRDGGHWQDMRWNNGYYLLHVNPDAAPRTGGFQEHLPPDVANIEATRDYSRVTASATVNHALGDWFTQRAVAGIDRGWEVNNVIFPIDPIAPVYPQTHAGEHNYGRPLTVNLSFDYAATVNYRPRPWLGLKTSVGAQYYTETYESVDVQGFGYASALSRSIDQTVRERMNLSHSYIENKSLGLYVQEEVALNDRFFLTGAVRFDDNSAFGSNFDLQVYPKVSAAWVVSEESFWNVPFMDQLRLRAALGQAGRQPDVLAGTSIYGVVPGPGGTNALWPRSPGNADVGPELSTELEAGFDYALLEDRLSGEFTYYYRKNEDALLGIQIPPSVGFPGSVQRNVGRIDNWGWEATLNARIYESRNFSFELALGGDHTMNEIKELGEFPGTTNIRIGYPYPNVVNTTHVESAQWVDAGGQFTSAYGQQVNGLCDAGVPLGDTPQHGSVPGGELVDCRQANGTRLLLGPDFPTYNFSVQPTVTLFNNALQVFTLLEGQYGMTGTAAVERWGHEYNNTLVAMTEDDPRWVLGDRLNDLRVKQTYDADFWKFREIGMRLNVPESLSGRVGASRASISVSARDMDFLWRRQPHVYGVRVADPEFRGPNGFSNVYGQPPLSSVNATLRLSF